MRFFKEKAVSKAQQRIFALALQHKRGELPVDQQTDSVKKIAKSMSLKSLEKYASTKHDNIPNKVDEKNKEGTDSTRKYHVKNTPGQKDPIEEETLEEAEYQGKKVQLNNPFRTPGGPKKFSVYVKNDKGNVVKVNFGDPNMEIKRDDPDRRKNFRARHNCDNPGPKWKARYWSCYQWRAGAKVDN